ncbi:hypothetical protein [Halobellus ordinarius]|uniref:hypothetical protein n=1 Tax=Halobellus ordinarius TaxID=3075120 RepID=UPI00287FFF20|nr:hypothetical protein [Halobellus sp. ZY16]
MPDLLTHVLLAYALGVLAVRLTSLPDRYLPVVMVGAVMPDVMKATVLLDISVGSISGIPYSFWAVHTLGGAVVLGGIGALTIRDSDRGVAFLSLVGGGTTHLFLDLFVIRVDGIAPPYLFPLTGWLPPAGNLYASTDVWPAVGALAVAILVWAGRRRAGS